MIGFDLWLLNNTNINNDIKKKTRYNVRFGFEDDDTLEEFMRVVTENGFIGYVKSKNLKNYSS